MVGLRDEVINDPLGRGYVGMSDQQVLDDGFILYRTDPREIMSAGEIMESIDGAEFTALTDPMKTRVDRVLGLGAEIIIGPGNAHNAVQELLTAFGAGSTTISNLSTRRDVSISRWAELGLGNVKVGHITIARS